MTGSDRPSGAGDTGPERIWVVDRVSGPVAVLVADDDERQVDVSLSQLPPGIRPGTVLRVPDSGGDPLWQAATVDEEMRLTRLREAEEVLARLRRRDPGGDITL